MAGDSIGDFGELNLEEALVEPSLDFDAWVALIYSIEKRFHDDIEKISLVFKSFLSKFPLCYGYWKKYADHKERLCTAEEVVEVYEEAVAAASYSVDMWVDYCSFSMLHFEDPPDVYRLFRRALSFVQKDYRCHTLWDKYIEFEFSQQHWNSLAYIYIQALKFPTKKLYQYYDSFKKLVMIWEEEMGGKDDSDVNMQIQTGLYGGLAVPNDDDISHVIDDLQDPSTRFQALQKYLSLGEYFYQRASKLDSNICHFEINVHRPYFHVKPLDEKQLENWHHYLDFVEMNGDFDWAVKLYERCLISCANYPEFWMRYVEYVESRGGREIANDALERASHFLKNAPAAHLFSANFKEQIRDINGARGAFLQLNQDFDSYFVDRVARQANMEKRLGNYAAAADIFKEALIVAEEKKPETLPTLYLQFSHLQYAITKCIDAAKRILIDGIRHLPHCKLLLEELIRLAMNHDGSEQVKVLDPIVANAVMPGPDSNQGLNAKDKEDISRLYMEFVDLYGTIHDSRKAWNRHVKFFPQLYRDLSLKQPARPSRAVNNKAIDGGSHSSAVNEAINSTVNSMILPSQVAKKSAENHELLNQTDDHSDCVQASKDSEGKENGVQRDPDGLGENDSPLLDRLSLNEQDDGSHDFPSLPHVHESRGDSSLPNGQVNESSSRFLTFGGQSPRQFENPNNEWQCSPRGHVSSRPQSSWRSSEERDRQKFSVSPGRNGSDWCSEDKHHPERSLPPRRRQSRWSSPDAKSSLSPPRFFSPDGRGSHVYPRRNQQNRPRYYDDSRARRGKRIQNDCWRMHNSQNTTITSTSQVHLPGQSGGYAQQAQAGQMGPFAGQYSHQYYENMQSSQQSYDQMWQFYFYQLQQQQQQPFQPQPQQQQPAPSLQHHDNQQPQSEIQPLQMYHNSQLQQQQFPQQHQQLSHLQQPHVGQQQEVNKEPQSETRPLQIYQNLQLQQQQQLYQQWQLQQQHQQQLSQTNHPPEQLQQQLMYQYQQQYFVYLQQMQQQHQQQLPQQEVLSTQNKDHRDEGLQHLDENASSQKGPRAIWSPSPTTSEAAISLHQSQGKSSHAAETGEL